MLASNLLMLTFCILWVKHPVTTRNALLACKATAEEYHGIRKRHTGLWQVFTVLASACNQRELVSMLSELCTCILGLSSAHEEKLDTCL